MLLNLVYLVSFKYQKLHNGENKMKKKKNLDPLETDY